MVFGGRSQATGELRLVEAKQVDGRWIVTATVPLDTIASQKFLRVYLNEDYNLLFPLPLRSHPDERDREWSAWVEAGWPADKPKPAPEAGFTMRYRVELVEPPPGPSAEEIAVRAAAQDEAKFQAVAPDAPIAQWLPISAVSRRLLNCTQFTPARSVRRSSPRAGPPQCLAIPETVRTCCISSTFPPTMEVSSSASSRGSPSASVEEA